jgi:hypothetical protein
MTSDEKEIIIDNVGQLIVDLSGPHQRHVPYLQAFFFIEAVDDRRLTDPVIAHGFCDNGPLSQQASVDKEIDEILVDVKGEQGGIAKTWQYRIPCKR